MRALASLTSTSAQATQLWGQLIQLLAKGASPSSVRSRNDPSKPVNMEGVLYPRTFSNPSP